MEYTMDCFREDCKDMGIDLSEIQISQFQHYFELLTEWNRFMNLTAITDFPEVLKKHYLDSLSLVKIADVARIHSVIDIGTGAGFPGIPLKIAFPHLKIVLLDSLGKRVKFLNHVIDELQMKEITAIHGRAEDFAKDINYREQFDAAVSRAVANLSSLCEYCIPYVKQGGVFVSYKSGAVDEELQAARNAIEILGGKTENVCKFSLLDIGERSLIAVKKKKATPKKYPRKAGMPSREPIL